MNDEERNAFAQLVSNRIQHLLEEKEDLENLLTVLGKLILEDTPTKQPTLKEIESLKSVEKTSDKGLYRLINKAENLNNPIFSMLQNYLRDHKGYAVLHGLKIWSFDDPDKICYRKQ